MFFILDSAICSRPAWLTALHLVLPIICCVRNGFRTKRVLPSPRGAGHVPRLLLDTGGKTDSIALSFGERVSRSGAFISWSVTGEGSVRRGRGIRKA